MIEKWRESVDKGASFHALLTNLSKAFDCIPHELLIAKLHANGFDKKSINLMYDYLFNRKQRVKVGGIYNSRREILYGVPQGWILGQLRFNIFLFDLCYFLEGANLISCADGNKRYNANLTPEIVIN